MKAYRYGFAAIAGALLAGATPAAATASLACSIDDKALLLEVAGIASHGLGEVLTSFEGTAAIRLPGTPESLKAVKIERETLTQYWLDGPLLKLRLYAETASEPHGSVEIVIEARRPARDGTAYPGTYRIDAITAGSGANPIQRVSRSKGKAACSVG